MSTINGSSTIKSLETRQTVVHREMTVADYIRDYFKQLNSPRFFCFKNDSGKSFTARNSNGEYLITLFNSWVRIWRHWCFQGMLTLLDSLTRTDIPFFLHGKSSNSSFYWVSWWIIWLVTKSASIQIAWLISGFQMFVWNPLGNWFFCIKIDRFSIFPMVTIHLLRVLWMITYNSLLVICVPGRIHFHYLPVLLQIWAPRVRYRCVRRRRKGLSVCDCWAKWCNKSNCRGFHSLSLIFCGRFCFSLFFIVRTRCYKGLIRSSLQQLLR